MALVGDITDYIGATTPPRNRYEELFILPAMPYHAYREPVAMPRARYEGKKQIFPVYDPYDVRHALANDGRYDILDWRDEVIVSDVLMKPFRYSSLLTNVRFKNHRWKTKRGVREKFWYFAKYDEDTPVRFFAGDIDDHGDRTGSREQVRKTIAMLNAVGLKPIWFTSPGDIYDGEHRQGLYFLVLLDQPMKVRDLRPTLNSLFKQHDLDGLEHCFVAQRRNFRLLGQEYVYPVNVDPDGTVALVDPGLSPTEQFNLTLALIEDQSVSSLSALVESAQTAPEDAQIESGDSKRRKRGLRPFRKLDASDIYSSACTFSRMTRNLVCPKAINKYPHDHQKQQAYAEDLLVSLSPADSKTCSSPTALTSLVKRALNWYRPRHQPMASSETSKKRERKELNDRLRFQLHRFPLLDLMYGVEKYVKRQGVALEQEEFNIVRRFFQLMQKYNGRVAAEAIYAGAHAITSQRRWFRLIRKIRLLAVLEEYDRGQRRCRQWGFDQEALQYLSTLLTPRKKQANNKIVVAIQPPDTPPSPPFSQRKMTTPATPQKHPWLFPAFRLTKQRLKLLEDPVFRWEMAA